MEIEQKEKIQAMIKDLISREKDISDNDELFESGLIDSLAFIALLNFIEREFSLRFSRSELLYENFNTLEKILAKIEEKLNQ